MYNDRFLQLDSTNGNFSFSWNVDQESDTLIGTM